MNSLILAQKMGKLVVRILEPLNDKARKNYHINISKNISLKQYKDQNFDLTF